MTIATKLAVCSYLLVPALAAQEPRPAAAPGKARVIELPEGGAGIGFDDLRYSKTLGRVLAPAGQTGNLALVDPASGKIELVPGFGSQADFTGGHGEGTTSVDEGAGYLFAIDRTTKRVVVVDPVKRAIVAGAGLLSGPDYVRYVAATGELWVTEPDADQIEVFALSKDTPPKPTHAAVIAVAGGPESLVIDGKRGRAYTHLWAGATVAIDLKQRTVSAPWKNGCAGSRGIALDEARGFLLVGCAEGLATVLDVEHEGKELGRARTGEGVDILAYDEARAHLYVPAGTSATLTILSVSPRGELAVLGTSPAASGVHSCTTDGNGRVFVGDPNGGSLLVIEDAFPATR